MVGRAGDYGYQGKKLDVGLEIFKSLNKNDILFIDSSHMIRPQGDVLLSIWSCYQF